MNKIFLDQMPKLEWCRSTEGDSLWVVPKIFCSYKVKFDCCEKEMSETVAIPSIKVEKK
jgi:hypothetical protein